MKYNEVSELKEGMILAEDIYDDSGILVISKNTVIDDKIIKILKKIQVSIVVTIDEDEIELISDEERNQIVEYIINHIHNNNFYGRKIYLPVQAVVNATFNELLFDDYALYIFNELKKINEYTINHAINVAMISALISVWMNSSKGAVRTACLAGFFHQAGKLSIDKNLLNKTGPLSEDELAEVKSYVCHTEKYLKKIEAVDSLIITIINQSCELLDGSGYPNHLEDDVIHPISKIISVANIYDAAVSQKNYKESKTVFEISSELFEMSMSKLSPKVTTPLIKHLEDSYHGLKVELSDGRIGEIVYINKYNSKKPIVKISENEFVDIGARGNTVKIVRMIN